MTSTELPWGAPPAAPSPSPAVRRISRAFRGPEEAPAWYRPALLALLLATAALYLWDLSSSGYANSFYAAAVQAGSKSWKAWFFGSLDSSNFITVDKPPASLWVMGLSARIFGFSSWSLLVPSALEGVAAVAILAATVRRVAGHAAALIAGLVLALTPAAVLIFRFDNPDAFLVLLLVAAAYCVTRALEGARTRWLLAAGAAVGFAFLTKSGEGLLPVPAFGLAYLIAAPAPIWRRIWQLFAAVAAMVLSAGWWILAVMLTPAVDRPYIGGSTDNNPLQLAFGYNGLSRLFGQGGGAARGAVGGAAGGTAGGATGGTAGGAFGGGTAGGGPGGGSSFGGATGLGRMFRGEFGLEISWLLPAALIMIAALVWLTWGRKRTDSVRAALLVWGGWLLVMGATFSYMQGTIHPYYTVALAPAIAGLVGIGSVLLWQRRAQARGWIAYAVLAGTVAVTCAWDVALLRSNSYFHPSTAFIAVAVSAVAVLALIMAAVRSPANRRLITAIAGLTGLAIVIPTTAWALGTAATPHTGSIPTAVAGGSGGFGGGFGGGGGFPGGGFADGRGTGTGGFPGGAAGAGGAGTGGTAGAGGAGQAGRTAGGPGAAGTGTPPSGTSAGRGTAGQSSAGRGEGFRRGEGGRGTFAGAGAGGGAGSTSATFIAALERTTTRWAAAVDGSNSAASLELSADGKAVMAIGGFTGSDPAPTLAQFEAYVAAGDITYYIAGGQGGGPGGGGGVASQITSWVEAHYKSTTVGGETVYVLHKG
jgi:4-amino-4-deoxy-L-arabinose transferase-like glycosyltransferase